jgi:hypothetical protein
MPSKASVAFGDKIRVRSTPETEARCLAGLVGVVYGETTPSVTGVGVIGELATDYAIVVHFEEHGDVWFTPELLEFADNEPGSEPRLVEAPKKMKPWFLK